MPPLDPDAPRSRQIRGRNTLQSGCGTMVVTLTLAVFAYLAWANTLPAPLPDRRTLPNPNGYDACAAAVAGLPALTSTLTPWDSDLETIRKDVAQAKPALATLSAAVRLPYLAPPINPKYSRQLARYYDATRQLVAATRVELADGRSGRALDWALDAVELGVKVGRGGTWTENIHGGIYARVGQKAAERCVSELSAKEAHAAGARLDSILAQLPDPVEVAGDERRNSLFGTRDILAGRSPITTSPAAKGEPSTWMDPVRERVLLAVYPKSWGYSQVDLYWDALTAELRKPYAQRKVPRTTPPEWDPVLGGFNLELPTIQLPFLRVRAHLRLLRAELALQEYRKRHGVYPAKLEELAPECLAVTPVDPFSEQPLRYRRQGGSYLLYSVGPDQKDDGGTPITSSGIAPGSRGDVVAGKLFSRQLAPSVAR